MPSCTVRLTKPGADFGEEAEGVSDGLLYSYRHKIRPSAAQCTPPLGAVARPCPYIGHSTHTHTHKQSGPKQLSKKMVVEEEGGDDRREKE